MGMINEGLSDEVLNKLYLEIRATEATNAKSGRFDDKTMVKKIVNIIYTRVKEEIGGED